ncbi:MAG: ZIP family metal transporter [Candidatus Omnitrophica bacterium]|nr:ZIP family metal transporter [Candidatus Omnitrophota bacterium]
MVNFMWSLVASIAVSLISLIGIFSLLLKEKLLDKILFLLIGFSAGGLIGGAFLHLLPEALEQSTASTVFLYVIFGFIFFFILERYLHWRHCHKEGRCDIHAFTYLNLIGDGIHNFGDGLVIGSSFVLGIHFGIITTLVIIFHEIPQEIGDFGVLVYGGFSKAKALFYNFISATTCILGTALGYKLSTNINDFSAYLLPFIAGGFIYVAACDLIPELHKDPDLKKSTSSFVAFVCGILFIYLARLLPAH